MWIKYRCAVLVFTEVEGYEEKFQLSLQEPNAEANLLHHNLSAL
jgi:hypothetical protein